MALKTALNEVEKHHLEGVGIIIKLAIFDLILQIQNTLVAGMRQNHKSLTWIITGIFLSITILNATASPPKKVNSRVWSISMRGGAAYIVSEISQKKNILANEFTHHPGVSYDIAISRTIGKHWEPGVIFGVYKLNGITNKPDFSSSGIFGNFTNLYPGIPVVYDNLSSSLLFFTRYHFFEPQKENGFLFNPFLELGAGINVFATEVAYKTLPPGIDDKTIFQKAGDNKGTVGQLSFSLGTTFYQSEYIQFFTSLTTDWVNYDCVDGVHNYSDGVRNNAETLVVRLLVGITISLTNDNNSNVPRPFPFSPR